MIPKKVVEDKSTSKFYDIGPKLYGVTRRYENAFNFNNSWVVTGIVSNVLN